MRHINMDTWQRREHFKVYSTWDYPHFNMCANIDLTTFNHFIKQHDISFNVAIIYIVSRAANDIPEFRYRIRGGKVIEHEIVHPSTTILTDQDLFTYCHLDYIENFSLFATNAIEQIAQVKRKPTLEDPPGRDDLLFMTTIPWVSFTSFMHPIDFSPVDSVPRFAWGKFFIDGELFKMPLSVQAHHALMDGIHMGRYFNKIQDYLHDPDFLIGEK